MFDIRTPITIAGAGSIGCYVGGCLALGGRKVTLLARPRIADKVSARGLRVADLDGTERRAQRGAIEATSDPARALQRARLVVITVKSGQTAEMAELISACAPSDATVVSFQNGVDNPTIIRSRLRKSQRVIAGMVPFNVVQSVPDNDAPLFRRATAGEVLVESGIPGLTDVLTVDGLTVVPTVNMDRVLWGKLVLNLNNALNALSGLPLAEQLGDRRWRRLLAEQMSEALRTMRAAGIKPAQIGRLRPSLLPMVLKLPNLLFRPLAREMLAIDPKARSSMWEDLERRRPTEIDHFQGAIVRLAQKSGRAAPVSKALIGKIRDAEAKGLGSPKLSPAQASATE
jgi:2-dehydropantoate 2-reductase